MKRTRTFWVFPFTIGFIVGLSIGIYLGKTDTKNKYNRQLLDKGYMVETVDGYYVWKDEIKLKAEDK